MPPISESRYGAPGIGDGHDVEFEGEGLLSHLRKSSEGWGPRFAGDAGRRFDVRANAQSQNRRYWGTRIGEDMKVDSGDGLFPPFAMSAKDGAPRLQASAEYGRVGANDPHLRSRYGHPARATDMTVVAGEGYFPTLAKTEGGGTRACRRVQEYGRVRAMAHISA